MPSRGRVSWAPDGPEQIARQGVSISLEVGNETPPLDAVRGITECLRGIESGLKANVARARAAGHSWQEIGDALGVSRQSAWERYANAERNERWRVVRDVLGSLGPWPKAAPSLEEVRAEERRRDDERERRRYGNLGEEK